MAARSMSFGPDRGLKACGTEPHDDDRSGELDLYNDERGLSFRD